ncbi:MAG: hypothetical protein P8R42_01360 [Candidatus Binatia bacterium]|nr:hypothetical protein [Candidatus Binatia bacterium]
MCLPQVCGNAALELGEEYDDGNQADDGCDTDCTIGACVGQETYPTKFEAIQAVVFEGYGCTSVICHNASPKQGQLALTSANAYAELLDQPSAIAPVVDLVEPGESISSVLCHKLAAGTNSVLPAFDDSPLRAGRALTPEHLETVVLL